MKFKLLTVDMKKIIKPSIFIKQRGNNQMARSDLLSLSEDPNKKGIFYAEGMETWNTQKVNSYPSS